MNQSDTNPLATALAALMTGHNANPNTSLRIPLVDSNGNLQPGPTLAELASVLGAFGGVGQVVNVPPNSDMDSLTTLGFYNINNASQVETIGNLPVLSTGRMITFPIGGVCLQVYFTYGSNYNVYVRSFATTAKNTPWKIV